MAMAAGAVAAVAAAAPDAASLQQTLQDTLL
jgi:hypothetical protein